MRAVFLYIHFICLYLIKLHNYSSHATVPNKIGDNNILGISYELYIGHGKLGSVQWEGQAEVSHSGF